MKNIKSVYRVTDTTSHWTMREHMGKSLQWMALTTDEIENKRIAWNSISGDLKTSGQVTFNEFNENETDIRFICNMSHRRVRWARLPPFFFQNPARDLEEDLRRSKTYAEEHVV